MSDGYDYNFYKFEMKALSVRFLKITQTTTTKPNQEKPTINLHQTQAKTKERKQEPKKPQTTKVNPWLGQDKLVRCMSLFKSSFQEVLAYASVKLYFAFRLDIVEGMVNKGIYVTEKKGVTFLFSGSYQNSCISNPEVCGPEGW